MKKTLAVLSAIALLGAASAASAQSVTFSFGVQQDRYERDYHYRDYERNFREREIRRWYASQPSYYRGRCGRGDLIIRDPYTRRTVCVDRHEYRSFMRHYRR